MQGLQGIKGDKGDTGIQGLKGDKGDKGDAGTTTWGGITDKPTSFNPSTHNQDASTISTGTLADARLSSNIARLDTLQNFKQGVALGRQNSTTEGGELILHYPENNGQSLNYSWRIDVQGSANQPNLRAYSTNSSGAATVALTINTNGNVVLNNGVTINGNLTSSNSAVVGFTPSLSGTGWAYTAQVGYYTRIGRTVEFLIIIGVSAIGSVADTVIRILGLPFEPINATFFGGFRPANITGMPSGINWQPYIWIDKTVVLEYGYGSSGTLDILKTTNLQPSCSFYLSGSYISAS